MRLLRWCVVFVALALAMHTGPQNAWSQTQLIVVVGAAGTPEYGQDFDEWTNRWRELGEQSKAVFTLIGGGRDERIVAPESSDHERLAQRIQSLKDSTAPVWLVLIGHGTFLKDEALFNLVGPDLSAKELSEWLAPLSSLVVLINGASASGPFVNAVSGTNRIVVAATKSGAEDNYARFMRYFSDAMGNSQADLDHDDEVSLLEAFVRASADVGQFYQTENRLSTEHGIIDDNGDGLGTPKEMFAGLHARKAKDAKVVTDGRRAAKVVLIPSKLQLPWSEDEAKQRDKLEQELDSLRDRREKFSTAEYDAALEQILVPLSQLYHTVESRNASP